MPSRTMRHAWMAASIAALVATTLAGPAAAAPGRQLPSEDELLIRFASGTTTTERAAIVEAHGFTPVHASPDGRTAVVVAEGRATATVRRELAGDARIVAVAPNAQRELAGDPLDEPDFASQWGLDNTGQTIVGGTSETGVANVDIDGLEALRAGIGGAGVVVAVIDDGVDLDHPELAARAWTNPGEAGDKAANGLDDDGNGYIDDVHGWDFCNDDASVHDAGEDGHGTHVAGTIAASLDGAGIVGVAPGVSLMALKFIDDGRYCGRDDMAVAAIDYAASFGVRIINASWGGSAPSSVLDAAIAESGALFVAAAGNGGANLDALGGVRFYPASSTLPTIVAVGAVNQAGSLAGFSNYGTKTVDLVAPGTNILSTYPPSGPCTAACYAWSAGTSMATPHVSGVAALVASHVPALLDDPVALRNRILATGRTLGATVGKTATGVMVNAARAIDTEPPTVVGPDRYAVPTGTIIDGSRVRLRTTWPLAADAGTGIRGYEVRRTSPSGTTVLGRNLTKREVFATVRFGVAYRDSVRATDGAGNVGGPAPGPAFTASLFGDGSSLTTYGPGWARVTSASATAGVQHASSTPGAWMAFTFTGRSVAVVAPKGASRGSVRVYVDGTYVKTVSLYRATPLARVTVFSASWTTKATHTLKLVVVGTAGHPRVDVDGFIVVR